MRTRWDTIESIPTVVVGHGLRVGAVDLHRGLSKRGGVHAVVDGTGHRGERTLGRGGLGILCGGTRRGSGSWRWFERWFPRLTNADRRRGLLGRWLGCSAT